MLYNISGVKVDITSRCNLTKNFLKKYEINNPSEKPDFSVSVSDEEFMQEKEQQKKFSDGYVENTVIYKKICDKIPEYNRFVMHAVVIEYKEEAYAFLAKSGVGKTTFAKNFLKCVKDAQILNGDKPFLSDTVQGVGVCESPWKGKEDFGIDKSAPLKAMFFIERGQQSQIKPIEEDEYIEKLFNQLYIPYNSLLAKKTLMFANKIVTQIPAFKLTCENSVNDFKFAFEEIKKIRGEK